MKCDHKDCFTCPYSDCIANIDSDIINREKKKPGRKKMDPELKALHKKLYRQEYYLKNKEKVKAHQKEYYLAHQKEICEKQRLRSYQGPILTNIIWINNGHTNKRIKTSDFKKYESEGWLRGRIV